MIYTQHAMWRTSQMFSLANYISFKLILFNTMLQGPHCSVNVPSLDFGLLQMGSESISSIDITNNSMLDAHWSLEELSNTKPPIKGLVQHPIYAS